MIKIKTRLKFVVSDKTNALIGFVTKSSTSRMYRGVNEEENVPKKICVLSDDLKGLIEPGVVYEVELLPMRKENGFVVVSAFRHKYEAKFETVIVPKSIYQIRIIFGHKIIYFDPKDGNSRNSRTIAGVEKSLRDRKDLADIENVIVRFREKANELLEKFEQDGYVVRR